MERKCACLGGVIALSIEDKMRGTNDEKRREKRNEQKQLICCITAHPGVVHTTSNGSWLIGGNKT